ncbi:NADPH-dependent FMN reductase [Croceicoccus sp. YJ47]|uniref:NADPH-dependent FMN reductase n=1 Tax=Croceicoccus sp. YJ47 TaxID=2798724 RepID=UPI003530526A
MARQPRIVGIGGTQRPRSSTELLVSSVLDICASHGAHVELFGGERLAALPHFDPYQPERTEGEKELVEAVRRADGIVIASPSYHGGVSGLIKNAIDLLEDLREDERPYFDGRPVGLLVSAAGWQAGGVTLAALRGSSTRCGAGRRRWASRSIRSNRSLSPRTEASATRRLPRNSTPWPSNSPLVASASAGWIDNP